MEPVIDPMGQGRAEGSLWAWSERASDAGEGSGRERGAVDVALKHIVLLSARPRECEGKSASSSS